MYEVYFLQAMVITPVYLKSNLQQTYTYSLLAMKDLKQTRILYSLI